MFVLKIKRHFTRQVRADNSQLHHNYIYNFLHYSALSLFPSTKKNLKPCSNNLRAGTLNILLPPPPPTNLVIFHLFSPPHHAFCIVFLPSLCTYALGKMFFAACIANMRWYSMKSKTTIGKTLKELVRDAFCFLHPWTTIVETRNVYVCNVHFTKNKWDTCKL